MSQTAILLSLAAAFIYAVAAIMLKRATAHGIGPWRVTFVTNWIQAIMFAPYWLLGGAPFTPEHLLHAAICGACFFVGQIFTFLALSRGDVSIATPVLGTKIILVALFTSVLMAEPVTPALWVAAVLTSIATAMLGSTGRGNVSSFGVSIAYGFAAAVSYALTDVFVQKWARLWGFGHFAPAMFLTVGLLSLGLIPLFGGPLRVLPWRWLVPGAALLGVQAAALTYAIIVSGSATVTNVLYNSRGIWTVLLVWRLGHWFENRESDHGTKIMRRRLLAALILLTAIILAVRR
ncbi:MAG TPA: DMT family transporter [Chthoniobacteraceae bacterium]